MYPCITPGCDNRSKAAGQVSNQLGRFLLNQPAPHRLEYPVRGRRIKAAICSSLCMSCCGSSCPTVEGDVISYDRSLHPIPLLHSLRTQLLRLLLVTVSWQQDARYESIPCTSPGRAWLKAKTEVSLTCLTWSKAKTLGGEGPKIDRSPGRGRI